LPIVDTLLQFTQIVTAEVSGLAVCILGAVNRFAFGALAHMFFCTILIYPASTAALTTITDSSVSTIFVQQAAGKDTPGTLAGEIFRAIFRGGALSRDTAAIFAN